MAVQIVRCGHCDHDEWVHRCDQCTKVLGSESPRVRLGQLEPVGIDFPDPQLVYGRQLVLCEGCARGGVDLVQLLATPPATYPELTR